MSRDLADAVAAYTAGVQALQDADLHTPSHRELLAQFAAIETASRRVPGVGYAMLARLQREADPRALGATSLWKLIAQRCRLSKGDAQRRLTRARTLAARCTVQGQPLPPLWEHTAAALAQGALGEDHLTVISRFFAALPVALDPATRDRAEATLADVARRLNPAQLAVAAAHLLAILHPDGELSDQEAARRVGLTLGRQQPDGTSYLSGWISPTLRALLEPVIATFAQHRPRPRPDTDTDTLFDTDGDAEGEDEPWEEFVPTDSEADAEVEGLAEADPEGEGEGEGEGSVDVDELVDIEQDTLTDEDIDDEAAADVEADGAEGGGAPVGPFTPHPGDPPLIRHEPLIDHRWRSRARYTHDAIAAALELLLRAKTLGTLNGLPTTVVVTTTLAELHRGAGYAVTGGGTRLPIPQLIALAARGAHHYLAVFDDHTGQTLHLGRAQRCATGAQKLALFARDRGCTAPGCDAPFYDSQAHHGVTDWKHGGRTDIDDLTLACGPDNRMIDTTDWHTRRGPDGRFQWIPPAHLDYGQPRTNDTHHPDRLLHPPRDHHPPRSGHPPDDDPL